MENLKSSKAIAMVATALCIGSLFWLMNTKRINNSLETGLQKEKLRSEAMLSEKLLLEKDIQKLKDQLYTLKNENNGLDDLVRITSVKLNEREAEYNQMKRENASLGQIKKQRQELQALKNELENELTALRTSYAALEARNNELNNTIASLQERNRRLAEDLNKSMFAAVDQSQIHAVKGRKERLTMKARRTKKIFANFEVPANLKSLGFRIMDSNGKALTSDDGTVAFTAIPSGNSLTASSNSGPEAKELQKIEMAYIPKEKLKTGVYTVEILNENLYVGSLKVNLK